MATNTILDDIYDHPDIIALDAEILKHSTQSMSCVDCHALRVLKSAEFASDKQLAVETAAIRLEREQPPAPAAPSAAEIREDTPPSQRKKRDLDLHRVEKLERFHRQRRVQKTRCVSCQTAEVSLEHKHDAVLERVRKEQEELVRLEAIRRFHEEAEKPVVLYKIAQMVAQAARSSGAADEKETKILVDRHRYKIKILTKCYRLRAKTVERILDDAIEMVNDAETWLPRDVVFEFSDMREVGALGTYFSLRLLAGRFSGRRSGRASCRWKTERCKYWRRKTERRHRAVMHRDGYLPGDMKSGWDEKDTLSPAAARAVRRENQRNRARQSVCEGN